jgi:DinB superfamily
MVQVVTTPATGKDMTLEQTLVDSALRTWRSNMDRISTFFDSLTPEELELEVAPGRNRLIYIWGHLAAVNDAILPLFGFGPRRYPELDETFVSPIERAPLQIPSSEDLKHIWAELDLVLWTEFKKLTPSEWLQRHQDISPEDFVREPHRTRYRSLLARTAHLAYHYGQAILAIRRPRIETRAHRRLVA